MSNLLGLEEAKEHTGDVWPHEVDPELAAHVRGGANWFYWIAGLSLVNSLVFLFGSPVAFVAGLGFTQIADAVVNLSIQNGAPSALRWVVIVFDLILLIMFALFGYYANKRFAAAFIIGILIYVIDTLLLLFIGALLPVGFHAFALFFIIRGFFACRKLNAYVPANTIPSPQSL